MVKFIELKPNEKAPIHGFDEFYKSCEKLSDAGILLNKKIVVVDFDNGQEIGKSILQRYPSLGVLTDRGIHLFYSIPKNVIVKNNTKLTAIGVKADYKTGDTSLTVIKRNNVMRTVLNNEYLDSFPKLPELPEELYPVNSKEELLGMCEGDGRNTSLYKHIMSILDIHNINEDKLKDIASFINKNVFKESLDIKELESTLQSCINKSCSVFESYWDGDKINIIKLAQFLVNKLDAKLYNSNLYFLHNGDYSRDKNLLLRKINEEIQLKKAQSDEVLHQLAIYAQNIDDTHFPIKLKNGYLLDETELIKISGIFTPFVLNVNYDKNAYDQNVDKFLDFISSNKPDIRIVVEEMLGHVLMTSRFPHIVFFLKASSGNNGKSTFLNMIANFTGELASALALDEFSSGVNLTTLTDKLVNLGDDIDPTYIESARQFKTLASGNTVMVKALYEMPKKLKNTATLIFTCNEMPIFKEKSGGVARRVAVIECENRVTKVDPNIDKKLSTDNAKSYILNLALQGMNRIIQNGGKLTESQSMKQKTQEYLIENDSILSYLNNYPDIEGKTFGNVYLQYEAECEDMGFKTLSKNKFGRRLKDLGYTLEVKKINNKTTKVIVKQ